MSRLYFDRPVRFAGWLRDFLMGTFFDAVLILSSTRSTTSSNLFVLVYSCEQTWSRERDPASFDK